MYDGAEAAFFKGGGGLPDIECAVGEELLAEVADGLGCHVVDVGGEFPDLLLVCGLVVGLVDEGDVGGVG